MFVKSNDLSLALKRLSIVASLDKTPPGVMLDISDDSIRVYYGVTNKAIETRIPAVVGEDEVKGKIAFDYKRLTETIEYCKSSGDIKVDDIEINLTTNMDGSGKAMFNIVKTIEIATDDGTEEKVVGKNSYELTWTPGDKLNMKQRALAQKICDDMFNEDGAESWSVADLKGILTEASSSDGKIIYITPAISGAFSIATNSHILATLDKPFSNKAQFPANSVKAIIGVIDSFNTDDIYMNVIMSEGKPFATLFFDEDKTTSLYMTVCEKSKNDGPAISNSIEKKYNLFQASIRTSVLKDNLKAAVALSAGTNGKIAFELNEDDEVDCVITAENTGASVNNTYRVTCESLNTTENLDEAEAGTLLTVDANLKQMLEIVNGNKQPFTGLDIAKENNKYFMRIGYLDLNKASELLANHIEAHGSNITTEEKMELRKQYITTSTFITLKNS